MPIDFSTSDIETFFGVCLADTLVSIQDLDRQQYCIPYNGPKLRYCLIFDIDKDTVMISGDPTTPWGAESMYEIGVPCTSIRIEPSGYGEKLSLVFYYGDAADRKNCMLTIMKRDDLDLVVWPSVPYPAGHPYAYTT